MIDIGSTVVQPCMPLSTSEVTMWKQGSCFWQGPSSSCIPKRLVGSVFQEFSSVAVRVKFRAHRPLSLKYKSCKEFKTNDGGVPPPRQGSESNCHPSMRTLS